MFFPQLHDYLLIIYKENVWTYLYLQYVKDRKAGKDRGIIILTCSQQLNCEGRRSTYTYIYIHIYMVKLKGILFKPPYDN